MVDYPWTSDVADEMLTPEERRRHHAIIEEVMKAHGPGTFHTIATHCIRLKLLTDPPQIWKRLSEMKRRQMVHRTGEWEIGPRKRPCLIWFLGPSPDFFKEFVQVQSGQSAADMIEFIMRFVNEVQIYKAYQNEPNNKNWTGKIPAAEIPTELEAEKARSGANWVIDLLVPLCEIAEKKRKDVRPKAKQFITSFVFKNYINRPQLVPRIK